MNIGINSRMINKFGGPIHPNEVDLIELGIEDSKVLGEDINRDMLDELASFNTRFSIHAPYASTENENIRVDLGKRSNKNVKVMKKVFEIASFLNAEYVVIHGGNASDDPRYSFLTAISNLRDLSDIADDYSITLLLENIRRGRDRDKVGVLPHELLQIIESVAKDNLKIVLDIGHAFLMSVLYEFDLSLYLDMLSPYIYHLHIHDNLGIPEIVDPKYGDQHRPLGHGIIDFAKIFCRLEETNVKNLVLELKTESRTDAMESIEMLRNLRYQPSSRKPLVCVSNESSDF